MRTGGAVMAPLISYNVSGKALVSSEASKSIEWKVEWLTSMHRGV